MSARFSVETWLGLGLMGALWIPSSFIGNALHLGIRLTLVFLVSRQLGELFFREQAQAVGRFFLGLSVWASALALLLTAGYYGNLPLTSTAHLIAETVLALVTNLLFVFWQKAPPAEESQRTILSWRDHVFCLGLVLVGGGTTILLARICFQAQTIISVRTPWTLLPAGTFILFALSFLTSALAAWKARDRVTQTFTQFTTWLQVVLITPLLYPLGYGFDGFIHRASEQVLLATGTLTPKPLYYIGQYTWVTWLTKTLDAPLAFVDTWLLVMGIGLPVLALGVWNGQTQDSSRWKGLFTILLLPLGAMVSTTPQSLAYLLAFAAVIGTLWTHTSKRSWIAPLMWAAWATAVHPLGGLPALCIVNVAWFADLYQRPWKKEVLLGLGSIGALVAIPFAFWAQGQMGNTPITWNWQALTHVSWRTVFPALLLEPRQTLALWIDAAEWTRLGLQATLMMGGLWACFSTKKPVQRWLGLTGLGLIIVRWLLEHVATFGFLIPYERGNYTERLSVLSALFLAPLAAEWLGLRIQALSKRSGFLLGSLLLVFSALWTLRVYDALPRHDAAKASSGWNVSKADLDAIQWIHEQSRGTLYAVLANQSVSASALEQYGFARYAGDVFYYPIPTSGPLYQLFLRVASVDGTTQDIKKAALLTESKTVFVVIDAYWWNADLVRERLAEEAKQSISFGDGTVWVYRFDVETTK